MDIGVNIVACCMTAGISILFAVLVWYNFRNFRKRNELLNRAHEMTGNVDGYISELVTVYRRNRSFRWRNQVPVITYPVGDKDYVVKLDYVEKREGHFNIGDTYHVCYVPSDPSCCIVEEFRKPLQRSRTVSLIGVVILCMFLFNLLFSLVLELIKILA